MRSRKVSARGRAGDAFPSSEDDWKRTCQLDVAPRARKRGRHGRGRTGDAADGDEPALAVVLAADRVSRAVARGNGKKVGSTRASTRAWKTKRDAPGVARANADDGERGASEADHDVGAKDDAEEPEDERRDGVVGGDDLVAALDGTGRARRGRGSAGRLGGGSSWARAEHASARSSLAGIACVMNGGYARARVWLDDDSPCLLEE